MCSRWATVLVALVSAGVVALVAAGPASAHSFLAATDPPQGARLAAAPDSVALQLSEAVVPGSALISVRRADGIDVVIPPPATESGDTVVRQPLPGVGAGVYLVSWQVTSAVDGHDSAGELAFAVGTDPSAEVPLAATGIPDVEPFAAVVAWGFFTGLAVASGGLTRRYLLGGAEGGHRWVRAGAIVALTSLLARSAVEGPQAVGARPTIALALPAAAVLLALVPPLARVRTAIPAGLLIAAAVTWSARSHSAASYGMAGAVLDAVHLVAAAAWAGALAQVVDVLWRDHRAGRAVRLEPVRRYARPALWLVVAVSLSGLGQAALLLPRWQAVWSTAYGQVLMVKTVLLAAALSTAAVARQRGLPGGRPRLLRRATASELWLVAGVLGAAALLVTTPPPAPTAALESLLGPPPITGPTVRAMDLAGSLTVDIAAGQDRLDVWVVSPSGGVEGATVDIAAVMPDGTTGELHPRPCGPGCFTQEMELPAGTTRLQVAAHAPGWTGGRMGADLVWPPPAARPERFDAMAQAMRAADEVTVTESVTSDAAGEATGASQATMSGAAFVDLMPWAGGGAVDVRPIEGRPDTFTFYLPGSRMFFEATVDAYGRLEYQRMVNPGHEIGYTLEYPAPAPTSSATEQARPR
ncbi:copper resistance protein CopC [Euzebya pacifica]|uniref:copper resistance CopC/CopD family protein n=1 Tax=Euzebya pacifica TaxID=1608957 RepID=UPI0030FA8601